MQKKKKWRLNAFTKFDQMSRVGSRDRHTGWRSKIAALKAKIALFFALFSHF